MSSMAKIFVVVNLVFGIVAFGSAATLLGAHDDYKREYEKKVDELKALQESSQAKIDDLELQRSQQTNKASEQLGRADQLQQQVEDLTTRLAAAESSNQTLRSSVESFAKDLGTQNQLNAAQQEFLKRLSDEKNTATEQMLNAKANLDKEIGNRVGLEQQVSELNDQVQTLAAEKGDVERQLREANFYLDKYRVKYGPMGPVDGAAGVVMAVKGPLVSISVGSADKVRPGHYYDLSRGASYVGRIKITSVDKNLSVGEFDVNNPGSGAPPQAGDKATPGND
jgi:multidrug efflux pump subunit AcrA (membrane-fusion protein)